MRIPNTKCFAEFFAGIGLVHEALRYSGWQCTYANDIDPKKAGMYGGHFGPAPYFHLEDVWQTERIVNEIESSPFLATASFPCTDLSLAGHFAGFEGDHSSTYFGFIQVLRKLASRKPKVVMLENVPGFLTSKNGKDFSKAVQALANEDYWIDCIVLDAKSFVPQSRPRVFVLGFHSSIQSDRVIRKDELFTLGDPWQSAIDAAGALRPTVLLNLMNKTSLPTGWATTSLRPPRQVKYSLADFIDLGEEQDWWNEESTTKHYKMLSDLHRREVHRRMAEGGVHVGTVYRRCRNDEMRAEVRFDNIAGCLRTPRGGSARQIVLVIADGKIRFRWMSPREYARLQGAPDFVLAENTIQSLFGFGDGVCVPVIQWIDQNILSPLFNDENPAPTTLRNRSQSTKAPKRVSFELGGR